MADRLSFGLVPQVADPSDRRVEELLAWVGDRAGVVVTCVESRDYEALAKGIEAGEIDVAWLPPLVFTRLVERGFAHELATGDRGPGDAYVSVLVARAGSPLSSATDLAGASVAWVDPLSASGYVVPRLRMTHAGIDLERAIGRDVFVGSHAAVLRAVHSGEVDVGATFIGFAPGGRLSRGAFDEAGAPASAFKVVESFGTLPPDVIAARATLAPSLKTAFGDALCGAADDAYARSLLGGFGVDRFDRHPVTGHDALAAEVKALRDSGHAMAAAEFLTPPDDG